MKAKFEALRKGESLGKSASNWMQSVSMANEREEQSKKFAEEEYETV